MSKKITFTNISEETIKTLSDYSVAMISLSSLRTKHTKVSKELSEKREEILTNRRNAMENGMSYNDATTKYSLVEIDKKITVENDKYATACKPHNDAKSKAIKKFVPISVYDAYRLAFEKQDVDAIGTLEDKSKDGKKVTTTTIEKSFNEELVAFIVALDGEGSDNTTACRKFADTMKTLMNGSKIRMGEISLVKRKAFNESILTVFINYLVSKKVIEKADNGTVTKIQY